LILFFVSTPYRTFLAIARNVTFLGYREEKTVEEERMMRIWQRGN
jgi:hypothetical protein